MKAIFRSAMVNFDYDASLHIEHPTRSLEGVSDRIGLLAEKVHAAGDPRVTPKGNPLPGTFRAHYWQSDLETVDQQDITDFLRALVAEFKPFREFLFDISESGGEVCVFIGIGSSRCCAHQFDQKLLADLAATGIDLRLDFYGAELPQDGLNPNEQDSNS